ncbi:MAG: Uma2 family endonuclease, partial [Verrucomicrobia bacterium]|nr:Uma2 family endonuclease [Verrucomicrobiota bacterium]
MSTLWEEICQDPKFQDLPYKIELNRFGQIIMSPATARHGNFQSNLAHLLKTLMPGGDTFTELGVETSDSVKVADVAWASDERCAIIENQSSASIAPEICVEVKSPSNSRAEIAIKCQLYLDAGALEFWHCD